MHTLEEKEARILKQNLQERYPYQLYPNVIGAGLEETPLGSQRFIFRLYLIRDPAEGDKRIFKTYRGVPIKQVIVSKARLLRT